jgi:hypothetical protein
MKPTESNAAWAKRETARIRRLCREAADIADLHVREAAQYAHLADNAAVLVRIDLSEGYVDGNVAIVCAKAARVMDTVSASDRKLAVTAAMPGNH